MTPSEQPIDFPDHFSGHAAEYARARPQYPAGLFAHLAAVAPATAVAWDCGTGNGQSARGLAAHFERVVATDASERQLAQATGPEHVEFRRAPAERSGLPAASVDLIAVAQAVHWFDASRFYDEVRRVARAEGVLAVWCYNVLRVAPEVDSVIDGLYNDVVGAYWPPERSAIETGYADLEFPFAELEVPDFAMTAAWDLSALLRYLDTWSSARRYAEATGRSALEEIEDRLADAWGSRDRVREIHWPLHLRVGRVRG